MAFFGGLNVLFVHIACHYIAKYIEEAINHPWLQVTISETESKKEKNLRSSEEGEAKRSAPEGQKNVSPLKFFAVIFGALFTAHVLN